MHWITEQKRSDSAPRLEWQVARRYSHFRSNHLTLQSMFSRLRLPKLPPKKLQTNSTPDPDLIARRMVALDNYLKQLLAIPAVCCCTQVCSRSGRPSARAATRQPGRRPPRGGVHVCGVRSQLLTFLGAYHGMNPCAFTAPPPSPSLLGRRSSYGLSRKVRPRTGRRSRRVGNRSVARARTRL